MKRAMEKFGMRGTVMLTAIVIASTVCAFAVPPNQISRRVGLVSFDGPCCMSFGQAVSVTEPSKPVPVVVTWNALYTFGDGNISGLMLNGGPCRFFGSGGMGSGVIFRTRSFQWIVLPADGLQPGTNTFTVCGGGTALDLHDTTLMVRLSK
jgi:hypothetical protein